MCLRSSIAVLLQGSERALPLQGWGSPPGGKEASPWLAGYQSWAGDPRAFPVLAGWVVVEDWRHRPHSSPCPSWVVSGAPWTGCEPCCCEPLFSSAAGLSDSGLTRSSCLWAVNRSPSPHEWRALCPLFSARTCFCFHQNHGHGLECLHLLTALAKLILFNYLPGLSLNTFCVKFTFFFLF